MRLGLQVPDFTWPGSPQSLGPTFAGIARNAEASGMASLWVMDHFFQISMVGPPEHEMLEGYTALAFAAGVTERIRLGTMVTGVTYRHPGVLVKTVTTLDVLSGGRAILGIGAAWNEEEHRGLGVPFPPLGERFERLEETLQIAHQMWAGDDSPYAGRHYQLERPLNSPPALSQPHPPILVGGTGEQRTLRLVARYADACNVFDIPDGGATITRKLGVLAEHCTAVGRDYSEIEKTVSTRLGADEAAGAFAERCAALAALGIEHAMVLVAGPWTDAALNTLATARPMLDGVAASA
jgi:F420-dependent oxidoreductase-like protein